MTPAEIKTALRHQALTENLTDAELHYLADIVQVVQYDPDTLIFAEDDESDDLYFIVEGTVCLLKRHISNGVDQRVAQLHAGHSFGELGFMDSSPRSCSIVSTDPVTVFKISRHELKAEDEIARNIWQKLIIAIGKVGADRLRVSTNSLALSLQAEAEHLRARIQFGEFFLVTMVSFGLATVLVQMGSENLLDAHSRWFGWLYLGMFFFPILFFIQRFRYPLSAFGLTTTNWRPALRFGLLFCGVYGLLYSLLIYLHIIGLLHLPIEITWKVVLSSQPLPTWYLPDCRNLSRAAWCNPRCSGL